MQALADSGDLRKQLYYEVTGQSESDLWFDYISDVGDGFDSTYTMAYHLTRETLPLTRQMGDQESAVGSASYETFRGDLLLFGGDEIYPTASVETYAERLTSLYNSVFPWKTNNQINNQPNKTIPSVFAIPGNHDWYDSLNAFSDIFCSQKRFAGWQTEQNRSYFAIKLPKGWWLFGTDMQLGSSLDKAQIAYFKKVMKNVNPYDRIILCNAEPHWITAKMYANIPAYNNRNMGYFEGGVLKHQVAVYIAGDRHYYRRHEEILNGKTKIDPTSQSKVQKIVAGGGGAFLHPTHNEEVGKIGKRDIFELRKTYPEESTSQRLAYWNLLFPLWNIKFGVVTGILYLLTAQAYLADLGRFSLENLSGALKTVVGAAFTQPVALFWTVLIFGGFLLFTDTHSKFYRFIAGPIHAFAHLAAVFVIGWFAAFWIGGSEELRSWSLPQLAGMAALIFSGGAIIGSWIMGIYLYISLNLFGRHHNEAFSSLKIADYKNFLRFTIDQKSGNLTIYPIGVERVVKSWKKGIKGEPKLVPDNLRPENKPFLIEEPIVFVKSSSKPTDRGEMPADTDKRELSEFEELERISPPVADEELSMDAGVDEVVLGSEPGRRLIEARDL